MSPTEQTIFEQFDYWRAAIRPTTPAQPSGTAVFVGCGTSYNLALSLAAQSNRLGRSAIAVPGGEWATRADAYCVDWRKAHVYALSRSGETTETVAAAKASRNAGGFVTAITVEPESTLAKSCDEAIVAATHPQEGIVMTTSASLMLLLGLQAMGVGLSASLPDAARTLLEALDARHAPSLAGRSHFVFLGGGALYGVALEGALKLMEMSQSFTQGFHPQEYRHGPVSLIDGKSTVILLYSDQVEAEAMLAGELQEKGALVVGFGGPGDIRFDVSVALPEKGLACLPALQLLGERRAQACGLDTVSPRHLTKVVTLV
ncbi:SIS domain-containing protein [Consotaella aegiceratis]|uniref:SIS domain-containing protein n=1 Tax=Consotaella aegiceratis TaxID=3097961 RepID=UPI002F40FD17